MKSIVLAKSRHVALFNNHGINGESDHRDGGKEPLSAQVVLVQCGDFDQQGKGDAKGESS